MRIAKILVVASGVIVLSGQTVAETVSPPLPVTKPLLETGSSRTGDGPAMPQNKPAVVLEPVSTTEPQHECVIPHAAYTRAPPVRSDTGCGFENVVVLTAVGAEQGGTIRFSEPVTVGCKFAKTFSKWVREDAAEVATGVLGSSLELLVTGPGYQCRRRNNKPDGKLSEHAVGTAVDISTFQTADGQKISVEEDWGGETKASEFLATVHKKACDRFTTVLGPDADPNHKSHFHLDIGCHGKDCTYLICQ